MPNLGLQVLHGGLVLTPKCVNGAGGTGTHLELCLKIDPKLQFMPSFLVNIVFKCVVCFPGWSRVANVASVDFI